MEKVVNGFCDNISNIIDLMVKDLNKRMAEREIKVSLTDAAKSLIIEGGYDPVYGARPLRRFLQKHVETLIAREILEGDVGREEELVIDARDGELVITKKQ